MMFPPAATWTRAVGLRGQLFLIIELRLIRRRNRLRPLTVIRRGNRLRRLIVIRRGGRLRPLGVIRRRSNLRGISR